MLDRLESVEAEQNLLGTLIMNPDSRKHLTEINEDYFSYEAHKTTFNSIKKLHSKGEVIDYITINEELKKHGLDGELNYLVDLTIAALPTLSKGHIKILEDRYKRRKIIKLLQQSMTEIMDLDKDISGINSTVAAKIDKINFNSKSYDDNPRSVAERVRQDLKKAVDPEKIDQYKYGIKELDQLTAGIHPEEVTTIAGESGVGKTAFALQVARRISVKGLKTLFISREMSDIQVLKRILTSITGIDGNKFRTRTFTKNEWDEIEKILLIFEEEMNLHINTTCRTVTEIKNRLRQLKADVIIVDYLQLLTPEKNEKSREREVATISRELKNISLDFKIPVISLSQLNEDGKIRESRAVFHDSNNVIKLFKPDEDKIEKLVNDSKNSITYNMLKKAKELDTELIEVFLEKQRDGRTGRFYQFYIKNRLTFKSIK